MRSKLAGRGIIVAVLLSLVAACTSTPQEILKVPPHALNKQASYAVLWLKPCTLTAMGRCVDEDDGRTTEAKIAIHGSADRIDLKQQYEDEIALSVAMTFVDAAPIIQQAFLREYKDALKAQGLDAVAVAEPIYEGVLKKLDSTRVSFADQPMLSAQQLPLQVRSNKFDFMPIYDRLGVDYLLVLELLTFNVERHYGPAGKPTNNPQVVTAIRVYLHEKSTGEVLFNDFSYDFSLVADEWERPPHYQLLADLLKQSLKTSIDKSRTNLMKLNF